MCRHPKHFRIRLNKGTVQCLHHECEMRRYAVPVEPGDPDFDWWMKSPNPRVEAEVTDEAEILFQTPIDRVNAEIDRVIGGNFWATPGTITTAMNTGIDENG